MRMIVGLLVMIVGTPYSNAVDCPSEWIAIGARCYLARNTDDWTSLTWDAAKRICTDANAHLPVSDNANEFNALYELIKSKGALGNAWLGCSSPSWDTFTCEGHTAFYNSEGDSSGYWPWKTGQPSMKASTQCLVLNKMDVVDTAVLTSAECGSLLSSTIMCEQAPPNIQTTRVVPQSVITTDPVGDAQSPTVTTTEVQASLGQTQPGTTQAATTEEVTEAYTTATTAETTYTAGQTTSPVTTTEAPLTLRQTQTEPNPGSTARRETDTSTVVPLSTTLTEKKPVVTTQGEAAQASSETVTTPGSSPTEEGHAVESGTCYVIMEPDPQANHRVRWLVPQPDPCLCERIRLGGINTRATARQYPVNFVDTVVISHDPVEIGNWLGCEPK